MSNTTTEGTKVYFADYGTDVSTYTAIETAISRADAVGCIQELGDVTSSRPTKKSKCINNGQISVSVGGKEMSDITMSLKFDALDEAGQSALDSAYDTNLAKVMIYEFNDDPGGTVSHPTYVTMDIKVSSVIYSFQKDDDIFYNVVITPLSNAVVTLAEIVTP